MATKEELKARADLLELEPGAKLTPQLAGFKDINLKWVLKKIIKDLDDAAMLLLEAEIPNANQLTLDAQGADNAKELNKQNLINFLNITDLDDLKARDIDEFVKFQAKYLKDLLIG